MESETDIWIDLHRLTSVPLATHAWRRFINCTILLCTCAIVSVNAPGLVVKRTQHVQVTGTTDSFS